MKENIYKYKITGIWEDSTDWIVKLSNWKLPNVEMCVCVENFQWFIKVR